MGTGAALRDRSPPPPRTPPAREGPAVGAPRPPCPGPSSETGDSPPSGSVLTQWGETWLGNLSSCQVTQQVGYPLLGKRGKKDSHQISSWRQLKDPPPREHMPRPLRGHLQREAGAPRDRAPLCSMWDKSSPRFPPVAARGYRRGQPRAVTAGDTQRGAGPARSELWGAPCACAQSLVQGDVRNRPMEICI